jgi:hypothetical protein
MRGFGCLLGLVILLTGCASVTPGGSPSPQESRFQTTPPLPSASAPNPSGSPVPVPAGRWAAIKDDLTARGVTAEPQLVSADAVTWNDGSLGCPEPGRYYTQALVEGMRVVVEAAGRSYDYRFGRSDKPVLCERPGPSGRSTTR